jgi:hypothetical protein
VTDSIAYLPQRGLPGIQPLDEALESAPLPLIVERRARSDRRGQREMREEWLPFTVEVVRDVESLQAAVRVRQQAYSRHLPTFSATLAAPEAADLEPGVAVLLARSKLDGSALGSMRIQTNLLRPLPVEASVELPSALRDANLAEATRLGAGGRRCRQPGQERALQGLLPLLPAARDRPHGGGRTPADRPPVPASAVS